MDRRTFLERSGQAAAALAAVTAAPGTARSAADSPNDRVVVCVAGVRGRGANLLSAFADMPDVDVKYVCDIDPAVLNSRVEETAKSTGRRPEAIADFRRALDDPQLNALVLGTPDHWHAIPTILACQAKKDVYVEKPDGHNILEGRTMVAAMKKHERVVQLGTQSRSGKHFLSAMEYLRGGKLGRPMMAKAWESGRQGALGRPPDGEPPAGVDYDTWLGPAPKRPFNPLRFHGNWRWFFDYGTGDLGNDGVHRLDVARWALEAAMEGAGQGPLGLPRSVSTAGGKYYFDDAQEWPDTLLVSYDYPGHVLSYEMRIWCPYPLDGEAEGAAVMGDKGYIVIGGRRSRAFSPRGEVVAEDQGSVDDATHVRNFLDCMRSRGRPAADLETVGQPSSLLCHIGNAAWRTGRTLRYDEKSNTFLGDDEANRLLTRAEYRRPWTLPSIDAV